MTASQPSRLLSHYNQRYADRPDEVTCIPRVRFPKDRYQAAVKWADSGHRGLEIGAGWGEVLRSIRPQYDELVATELSQPRADALAEEFAVDDGVTIFQHDIENQAIPYPDNHFDTVLLIAVIEHLVDPVGPLQEIHRVLRPGGKLLVDTPNIAKWTRRIKLLFGVFPATASQREGLDKYGHAGPTELFDEGHLHYFTHRSLGRLLTERVGFARIDRKGYGPQGALCAAWPTMLSDILLVAHK